MNNIIIVRIPKSFKYGVLIFKFIRNPTHNPILTNILQQKTQPFILNESSLEKNITRYTTDFFHL